MMERQKVITDIIRFKGNIDFLEGELNSFPWDWSNTHSLYTIKSEDILRALKLIDDGLINHDTIEKWANIIEGREDIDYENEVIQELIIELANPLLFGDLSGERIIELKELLS